MKDYTIMTDCGIEQYEKTKRDAFREARKHKKECQLESCEIFIDESENHELIGNYWKI